MRNVVSLLNGFRLARDQELLRRQRLQLHAAVWVRVGDAQVVGHGWRDDLARHGVDLRLADWRAHCDVDFGGWVGHEGRQGVVVDAGVFNRLKLGRVFPVALEDADLAHQCVHERAVHLQEAAVVAVDDEIRVLSGLLRRRHVLRVLRDVFNRAVGAVEDPHQRRHDRLYGIPHVHANHLAAALFLVAKRLAAVVLRRRCAHRGDPVVDEVDGVVDLFADDALQLLVVHDVWVQFSLELGGHFVYLIVHVVALLATRLRLC